MLQLSLMVVGTLHADHAEAPATNFELTSYFYNKTRLLHIINITILQFE